MNELQCELIIAGYRLKWKEYIESDNEKQKELHGEMKEFKKEFDCAVKTLNTIKTGEHHDH